MDISKEVFQPANNKDIWEDPAAKKYLQPRPKEKAPASALKETAEKEENEQRQWRPQRVSDLETQASLKEVLDKFLKTQIMMDAGTVLGISKEVSSLLQEAIRPSHKNHSSHLPT